MNSNQSYGLNIFSKYSTHNIIISLIGNNKKVLDIGCNSGYIGANSDASNIFYGIEYNAEAGNKARTLYSDVVIGDLNTLPSIHIDDGIDLVVFADVLEHIIDPVRVLTHYSEYLKSDGKIIISLPNIANWQMRLQLLFGNFDATETGIMDHTHLHYYTFKKAKKLIIDSGLRIDNEYGGASIFGPIIRLFPFLRGLLSTNIILTCTKA